MKQAYQQWGGEERCDDAEQTRVAALRRASNDSPTSLQPRVLSALPSKPFSAHRNLNFARKSANSLKYSLDKPKNFPRRWCMKF